MDNQNDDSFDLNATFSAVPLNEDTLKKDSKVKKRAEKRAKLDRDTQVTCDRSLTAKQTGFIDHSCYSVKSTERNAKQRRNSRKRTRNAR